MYDYFVLVLCYVIRSTMSQKHYVTEALCHRSTMSQKHYVTEALCHRSTMSQKHYVTEALCHRSTMSQKHYVTEALCHRSTMSQKHYVTEALCHRSTMSQKLLVCIIKKNTGHVKAQRDIHVSRIVYIYTCKLAHLLGLVQSLDPSIGSFSIYWDHFNLLGHDPTVKKTSQQ